MLKVANSVINASQIKTPITFAGDVTLSTGNLVIGTSGKGIDFSITSHPAGMTSELLADYEEGSWTPIDSSGASLTLTVNDAYYTKIGRVVNFYLDVTYPSTVNGSAALIGGLPFAPTKEGGGSVGFETINPVTPIFINVNAAGAVIRIFNNISALLTNAVLSTERFQITGQYIA